MAERLYVFDTTLRDGGQASGVDFSAADKVAIAKALDGLGVDYVEGGWPGANPTDDAFFGKPPGLGAAKLTAFGMTRRPGRSPENDPGLQAVLQAKTPAVCLVGKSWSWQVEIALGTTPDDNLGMIADSVKLAAAQSHAPEAMFDAEHFFDGYKADPGYALACLKAAHEAGARWLVLCDTNGGTLPDEIEEIVGKVALEIPGERLGIHCHNDTENAVANTLAAVRAGVRQIQGTLNGLGERCGNANLVSLIPSLILKMGYETGISDAQLTQLTRISRMLDERLNRAPNRHVAYVGDAAFTHKGGLHVSAVTKDPRTYEHIEPSLVGNARRIVVSDQAGRSNLLSRFADMGVDFESNDPKLSRLLEEVKEREFQGYAYDGAEASFELLARRMLGQVPEYFELISFRVMDERRFNARGELITLSEATIKVDVQDQSVMEVAEGNGPVNALDQALRKALAPAYPCLTDLGLVDYKVRILTPDLGTEAITRVIIESEGADGQRWSTVGVSANVIDASYNALHDSLTYMIFKQNS